MKKIFRIAAIVLGLSAPAFAQEPEAPTKTFKDSETRCTVARGKLGEGQPIHIFFSYWNWAAYNKDPLTINNSTRGYALIKNGSFKGVDTATDDVSYCASRSEGMSMELRVYIKPQLPDISKTYDPEFFIPFTLDFKGASDPKNPFDARSTSLNASRCREVMNEVSSLYYFDGFSDQAAKSSFFLRAGANGSASSEAIRQGVTSYCDQLLAGIVASLKEQYTY